MRFWAGEGIQNTSSGWLPALRNAAQTYQIYVFFDLYCPKPSPNQNYTVWQLVGPAGHMAELLVGVRDGPLQRAQR
jgi:hypothetical protein